MQVGYERPAGEISGTFGEGMSVGWSVGRRVVRNLSAEGGVSLGNISYANARSVDAFVCTTVVRAYVCSQRQVQQEGTTTVFDLGLAVPLRIDAKGRALRLGAGATWVREVVWPPEGSPGARSGPGVYGKVSADFLPVGAIASIGLALRGALFFSQGSSFGTALSPRTTDGWLNLSLFVAVGRAGRTHPMLTPRSVAGRERQTEAE